MSDIDKKIKTYKNPEREKQASYKPYVPQYQIHGKDPTEYHGAVVPSDTPIARPSTDNPRNKGMPLRQPYASADTLSPVGRGRGPVPNVGNNMEHTWSSSGVDGDIVDDLSGEEADPNHPMIDNNEFVTDEALGFRAGPMATELQQVNRGQVVIEGASDTVSMMYKEPALVQVENLSPPDDLLPILADLSDDTFLLIVTGVPVCSGPKEEIQDQARALVFGEHEICDGNPVPIDDIIILKRVKVKVGLFLE